MQIGGGLSHGYGQAACQPLPRGVRDQVPALALGVAVVSLGVDLPGCWPWVCRHVVRPSWRILVRLSSTAIAAVSFPLATWKM
jgi:hypothetical protein